ncbi:hypothetical protein LIA77_08313 [Sarocladium implicatum]|nr:hypothetical protein LIA77_08313 [Sarocladium implicatum]
MPPPTRRRQAPAPASAASSSVTKGALRRPAVLAVAFAAVIVVGSLTGAQLKQDKQKEQAIKEFRAVQPADQIRTLEEQRKVLMEQRGVLQRKIDVFGEKIKKKEMEKDS